MKRILLLEDDLFTSRLLKGALEKVGFIVVQSFDVSSAFHAAVGNHFDLAIFDVQLPSGSSLDSFSRLKKILDCPVIVYTAKQSTRIELKSFEMGASDFLLKQRGVDILISRVNRLVNMEETEQFKVFHEEVDTPCFEINKDQRTFEYNGTVLELTKNEANILFFILSQDNFFADREELSYSTKGHGYDGWSRALDLAISRLRRKISQQTCGKVELQSVRGKGYKVNFRRSK
ncbi:response regulator transcription factor [Vibrio sp. TRT 1302]|uniref:response regulator transcription factor n=1 Tax=Vibrio sp. TRT 1302 TaxID=3418504 RepID=UPI003CEBE3FB